MELVIHVQVHKVLSNGIANYNLQRYVSVICLYIYTIQVGNLVVYIALAISYVGEYVNMYYRFT